MFLEWQISFHRGQRGNILLDIAFKEHPAFSPLAEDGQLLVQLLDTWNLRQEQQLYQVLEQVFLRFAKHQQARFRTLALSDDRLAFDLQTVQRPGLQLLALEASQRLVLVVPLGSVSLELIYGQLAALNPQQPVEQVAAQLLSEMKVKALYKLLAGKMTADAPHLETFLPPQLTQLIGAKDLKVSPRTRSPSCNLMQAWVQHRVAAAATEFTWRQQLFTHLADEIGWPLRIDDAQQRWACYTLQIGKGSAVLYVEAESPFPSKAPRLSLQAPGGQAAQIIRIPQYDWSERWPPSRMAQQVKAIVNKQVAASPGHSRSSSFTEQLSRAGLVRTQSGSIRGSS
ncbi:hypothetical protein WJX74_009208 [Apatococcus lobatus]|uniref:BRISC and BRCA1-A complex member 2 n=1 Tax=Apatococcus lobatus TaxID=904363 RepID=A0AAW1RQS3_9CHLO